MPIARVQLPDGRIARIQVPEGATTEEIQSFAASQFGDLFGMEEAPPAAKAEPETTIGGQVKEALKGLIPGAAGLGETAITGAAALLPDEQERAVRSAVSRVVEPIRETFAPEAGYEEATGRKLGEAIGSTLPFFPLGALGLAGRAAAVGLGVGAGAGEARLRAEEEGATEGERGLATALGIIPGALEVYAPIQILGRFGFGDEAIKEVIGFLPALKRVARSGGEEALQEASSQVIQNLIEKGVYNPEEAAFGGVGEAAAMGGGAGAVIGAVMELALGRRLRGAAEEPQLEEEKPLLALPPPRQGGVEVDSEGRVVRTYSEAEVEARTKPLREAYLRQLEEDKALGIGEADAIAARMGERREKQFLAQTEEALRKAALDEDAAAAAKDDLAYLRSLPMEQQELALQGGIAQPELDLLGPTTEAPRGMYTPAEEALGDLRPRSRAYKEEAKDLGLKLDKKGNVKPNQFVFQMPETTVAPGQERFDFEYDAQQELPLTRTQAVEGQGDLFADEVPLPRKAQIPTVPMREEIETPPEGVPEEQTAFFFSSAPIDQLPPRQRVLRAMIESDTRKTPNNLKGRTGLTDTELKSELAALRNEGVIRYVPGKFEWELTPEGEQSVRSGAGVRTPRPRRGAGLPVQRPRPGKPPATGPESGRVAGTGGLPPQTDGRTDQGKAPLTNEERMAIIRRTAQRNLAQQAVKQVVDRKSDLSRRAVEALDADQISEKTYDAVVDELKKSAPNFARAEALLSGTETPKTKRMKFQRDLPVDEVGEEIAARKAKRQEAIEIAKANANSAFADQTGFQDLNESIGAYQDNVRDTLQEYGLSDYEDYAISAYEARIKELTEKETPRKQRGEVPATPKVSLERAKAVVADAIRGWTNPPTVVVARSANDPVLAKFRDQIPKDAKGFYIDGTTYVIADRATDEAGLRGTVFHESLGHYGLEQEFQDGLRDEMLAIYRGNKAVQNAADARIKQDPALDKATAVEEVLAEKAEAGPIKEGPFRSAFNRIAGWIRNWLRSKGLVSKYSDNDVAQILRRAQERVTKLKKTSYDPFDPKVRYQRTPAEQREGDRRFINSIGKIPFDLPQAGKDTYDAAANAASNVPGAVRRGLYGMLNAHDLDRMYGKITKGFGKLWKYLNQEGVALRSRQDQIVENIQNWQKVLDKYPPAQRERFYKVMMDTTVEQVEVLDVVDPSRNINWKAKKDSPVYKEFDRLPKDVKEVYKQLRLAYIDYSLGVEKMLQQYLTPTEWQKMLNKFNERRLQVYLPLFRNGQYKLTYTDKTGEYVALQFESVRERDIARSEARRAGATDIKESLANTRDAGGLPSSGFFGEVVGTLKKAKVSDEVVSSIVNTYLDYMPAKSVLQMSRRREGVTGFSNNVLEAYANVGSSYARRLTNMEFAPKFREAEEEIRADIANKTDTGELPSKTAEDLILTVDRQMDFIANPSLDNWAAKLSYFSYQMYLGANISTAIVNTLDLPTITLSRLGGKYGFADASAAILRAGSNFFKKQKSPEIAEVIKRGLDSGVLREQQLRDIAEFKNIDSKLERMKAGVERMTNWAFAKSDMFNRETTFLAAYELAKKANKSPAGTFDQKAFEEAERAVYDVYGSSFPKAAPPITGNGLARTALTFKRFAIVRTNLLVSAMREAGKGESKEVRDAARKELIGYFGTAYVFAGVQGMPVVGAGMALVSALNGMFGDDDEPYNPDFTMREAIGLFNYKGPINYLTGVDIASRTGWTGMFWREDPKRMAEVGPVTYTLEQFLGPAYSYAVGVPRAFDYMSNGQYGRAFEQLAPRAVGNINKGIRYATEGAYTANGMPLVDDVNAYNSFMQVFGFRPSDVAEAGEEAGAAKRMESKIFERRNAIIARAALAQMSGDADGFIAALEEAQAFSSKNPTKAITGKVIKGAIERRQKKILDSVNGVRVDPKLANQIYDELGITR